MIKIKNRFTGNVIIRSKKKTIKEVVEYQVKKGADLEGAYLEGVDLRDADLRGADLKDADLEGADLRGADLKDAYLEGADLRGADLRGAYLRGAYLRGADLRGADLRGADLRVKTPPVNSYQFISEVLYKKSETEIQLDFSGRIRLQTNECWKYFIKLARKKKVLTWAKKILFQWEEFKEKLKGG